MANSKIPQKVVEQAKKATASVMDRLETVTKYQQVDGKLKVYSRLGLHGEIGELSPQARSKLAEECGFPEMSREKAVRAMVPWYLMGPIRKGYAQHLVRVKTYYVIPAVAILTCWWFLAGTMLVAGWAIADIYVDFLSSLSVFQLAIQCVAGVVAAGSMGWAACQTLTVWGLLRRKGLPNNMLRFVAMNEQGSDALDKLACWVPDGVRMITKDLEARHIFDRIEVVAPGSALKRGRTLAENETFDKYIDPVILGVIEKDGTEETRFIAKW